MTWLWLKFQGEDPTKGKYDRLPLESLETSSSSFIPAPDAGRVWVKLTKPEYAEYVSKTREKSEILTLRPLTNNVVRIDPVDISSLTLEDINVVRNKIKRIFGEALVAQVTDLLGGRNVSLNKDGNFVVKMSTDLQTAQSLLNNGALKTAYSYISYVAPKYLEHKDIFDLVKKEIQEFLVSIAEW